MTAEMVFDALVDLGGAATASNLGERLGGYEGGGWTSPRLFLRLRELLRALRVEGRIGKVGEKRSARYFVVLDCSCGHPKSAHVFDDLNPCGECCALVGPGGETGSQQFCECEAFVARAPFLVRNPGGDEPGEAG